MIAPKLFIKELFKKCEMDYAINGINFELYFEDLEMCVLFYKDKKDIKKEEVIIKILSEKVYLENGCYENSEYCEKFVKVIHIKESEFCEGLREVLLFMDNNAIFALADHM